MSRKANGEGSINKLPSGKYRLRVVVDIDGTTQRKSFTASSPTACRKAYQDWMLSDNKVAIEKVKTVAQWAAHWLEVYKKPKVSWKVGKDYEMYVNKHILPAEVGGGGEFGSLKLADVKPAHVAKLYTNARGLRGPLSHTGLNYIRLSLNGIFNTAKDNGFCAKNPAENVSLPETRQAEVKAFNKKQMAQIIRYLDSHPYGPYVALLLYTGLRVGELLALMWTDIDTKNKVIYVRRSMTRSEKGTVVGKHTKTKKERIIPYDDTLQRYIEKLPVHGLYVVSKPNGSHHTHGSFDTLYYRFFKDLNATIPDETEKIPKMSPHKCRHTFGTYLLRSDVDIRYVQTLMGHSTIKTTEIYTEVDVDDLKDNVSKLNFG